MKSILSTLTFFGILFLSFSTKAQKLPNTQKASVWAPQNIKIDGKATEWDDKYQAYNSATDIHYTLSNDDKNLYLLIKATRSFVIGGKILAGGVGFTINHTLSKKDPAAITVTYPLLEGKGSVAGVFYGTAGLGMETNPSGDNSLNHLNKTFTENSKYIGITGIKSVAEKEIPIYNNLNIQVASAFHAPAIYIYELAIPLALLALPEHGTKGFSYHIKLNPSSKLTDDFRAGPPVSVGNSNLPPPPTPAPDFITPTDFWGEYTLAKKP